MGAAERLEPAGKHIQILSLAVLVVDATKYQTRADLDMEKVRLLSDLFRRAVPVDPILVVRLPDGRHVLVGGFHRVEAARRAGLRSIRAEVIDGTEDDLILLGVHDNMSRANMITVTDADRMHAAEQMIRNKTTWDWADMAIARECGISPSSVRKLRGKLLSSDDVPIPERVRKISVNRKPTNITVRYRNQKRDQAPTVDPVKRPDAIDYRASFGGRSIHLARNDPEAAEAKVNGKGIETVGELAAYTNTVAPLTMIRGIGEAAQESILEALDAFWAANPDAEAVVAAAADAIDGEAA